MYRMYRGRLGPWRLFSLACAIHKMRWLQDKVMRWNVSETFEEACVGLCCELHLLRAHVGDGMLSLCSSLTVRVREGGAVAGSPELPSINECTEMIITKHWRDLFGIFCIFFNRVLSCLVVLSFA
jgi:hypothetical protein